MTQIRNGTVLKQIRSLFNLGATARLTDGQLLEQFATRGNESSELAFAALVERHEAMVLRACRGIVQDEHDAQDAFQATFLILLRRAGTLWVRESLGPWLHRVACRVATRARRATDRRRAAERETAELARDRAWSPAQDDRWRVIHEEIDRLSDRYRIPIILCDVEDRTYEEAARHLGCPIGTVKSRLARGREQLRGKLARRGVFPAAGLVGLALGPETAWAGVPVALRESTYRAAAWFVTAKGTGAPFSTAVVALGEGASRTMVMIKLGKLASAGLVLVVVAIGGGTLIRVESHQPVMANGVADAPKEDDPRTDLDTIQGTWVRISTDGRKADSTCRMVVKKATVRPKSNVPDGATAFDFEWKTDGDAGGSHNLGLLDPTGSPKTLDFIPEPAGEDGVPEIAPGIYKLEGDTLTVCFMNGGPKRPTDFVAGRQGVTLDIYRRVKP